VSSAKAAAVALTVLGAGLVVGSVAGRARALIIPAVVLVPVVATLGTLDHVGLDPFHSIGQRTYQVDGLADPDLRPAYHLGTGDLRLDLSRFDPQGAAVPVRADVAVGSLRVWVPTGVEVAVHGEVAGGALEVAGDEHDGRGEHRDLVLPGVPGRGRIDLDVEVGFGALRVTVGSAPRFTDVDGPPKPLPGVAPKPVPTAVAPATPTAPTSPTTPSTPAAPTSSTVTAATTVGTTSEGPR
jgi:hypothetical protein